MKISKNSWHYRLHRWVRDPLPYHAYSVGDVFRSSKKKEPTLPRSLCGYFWSTVGLAVIYVPLMLMIGIFSLLVLAVVAIARPIERWRDRRKKKKHAKRVEDGTHVFAVKPPKEPGLFRSFVRASKDKVCPLIEVVDE